MKQSKWAWVRTFGVLILLGIALAVAAIAAGAGDPRPFGPHLMTVDLQPLPVAAKARSILPLETIPMPRPPFSLKLRAALKSGDPDSAYGLRLEGPDGSTAVMVSPLGTVAITGEQGDGNPLTTEAILPWQTWPHVRRNNDTNEIWLDITPDRAGIRINGELLWSGSFEGDVPSLALLGESYGDTAVIDFQQLELFAKPPPTLTQAQP